MSLSASSPTSPPANQFATSATTSANHIKVLLADDHPMVMTGFAMALAAFDVDVVGQARTPQEAVALFTSLQPDVAILDMRFGDEMTGMDAAREILLQFPKAKIIFLSQFDQDSLIKETYRLGACAFLTKDCDPADLAQALQRAHAGERYFMPQIAQRLANLSIRGDASPRSLLDERELEIFTLMAEGMTNNEIAEKLDLSTKTISNISQAVKEKLGVQRPAYITKLAVKYGLIEP